MYKFVVKANGAVPNITLHFGFDVKLSSWLGHGNSVPQPPCKDKEVCAWWSIQYIVRRCNGLVRRFEGLFRKCGGLVKEV